MTPEAQQIAIAEACGWKDVKHTKHEEVDIENRSIIHWSGLTGIPPEFAHWANRVRIPDYLNDLNAMHEVEKVLSSKNEPVKGESQRSAYLDWLGYCGENNTSEVYGCVSATASQRAKALLKALNLWKP